METHSIDEIADSIDDTIVEISVSEAEIKYKSKLKELNKRQRRIQFSLYSSKLLSAALIAITTVLVLASFWDIKAILELDFNTFMIITSTMLLSTFAIAFFITPARYDDMYLSSLAEGATESLEDRMVTVTELYRSKKIHPLRETILCDLSGHLDKVDSKKAVPKKRSTQKLGAAALFTMFLFLFANETLITSTGINDSTPPLLSDISPGDQIGDQARQKGSIMVVEFNVSDDSNFVVNLSVIYESGESISYIFENKNTIRYPIIVRDNLTYQIFATDVFGNERVSYLYRVKIKSSNESEFDASLLLEQISQIINDMNDLGLDTDEEQELLSELSQFIDELEGASNSKYMEIAEQLHLAAQRQREVGEVVSEYSSELGSQISVNANLIGQFSNYLILYALEQMGQSSSGGSGSYSSGADYQYSGQSGYGEYVPSSYTQVVSDYYSNLA